MKLSKNCLICSAEFYHKPSKNNAKFCSAECRIKARIKPLTIQICKTCHKEFTNKRIGINCSVQCRQTSQNKKLKKNCDICKKEFFYKLYKKDAKYCSDLCRIKASKGRESPNAFYKKATKEQKLERLRILFNERIIKTDEIQCWDWQGNLDKDSYGLLAFDGKQVKAHRVSWILHNNRSIPKKMLVCHRCDRPICVSPFHLFLGTHMDNIHDCMSKNRRPKKS